MPQANEPSLATYRVPALDKGLDILECLSDSRVQLTQAQIARRLQRSPSEIFRMLATLERRGYIMRDSTSGGFSLTLKLFELGQVHSPYGVLARAAREPMRDLANAIRQACHLSVIWRGDIVVLYQEEAPTRVRLSVETGSAIPALESASGRLLVALLSDEDREALLTSQRSFQGMTQAQQAALLAHLGEIRHRGYESARSEFTPGVSDIAVPIGTESTATRAALAVAALCSDHSVFLEEHVEVIRRHADRIARSLGLLDRESNHSEEGD